MLLGYQPNRAPPLFFGKMLSFLLKISHLRKAKWASVMARKYTPSPASSDFQAETVSSRNLYGIFQSHSPAGMFLTIMIRLLRKLRNTFRSFPLGRVPPPT